MQDLKALRTYDRYRAAPASRTCAFSGSGDAAQQIKNRASGLGAPDEAGDFSPPLALVRMRGRGLTRRELCMPRDIDWLREMWRPTP